MWQFFLFSNLEQEIQIGEPYHKMQIFSIKKPNFTAVHLIVTLVILRSQVLVELVLIWKLKRVVVDPFAT